MADEAKPAAPQEDLSQRACPACKATTLGHVEDKKVQFLGCQSCFGLLVEERALAKYVVAAVGNKEAQKAFDDLLQKALKGMKPGKTTRSCPYCFLPLGRFSFGEAPLVILDRCPSHGLWLDRSELKKVVRASRAHGAAMGLLPPFGGGEDEGEG